jgi:hypothetical protein
MNNNSFIKSKFIAIITIGLLIFNSCQKENVTSEVNLDDEFGKFTKEIIVYDSIGENSAILKLGSNDKSVLDMWTADNFELVPIEYGQTLSEIMNEKYPNATNEVEDVDIEEEGDDDIVAAEISTMFISKDLQEGVKNVALTTYPPYDEDMRGWSYDTHYSVKEPGNNVTVNIYGHKWHRGYYGVYYMKYESSGWSTIKSEWTRIKNGESKSCNRKPCYYMKTRRKSKKGSVTVEYEY